MTTEYDKQWTGNWSMFHTNHRHKEEGVADYDFYATHYESVELFLTKCKERGFVLPEKIWEPACGRGHISKVLEKDGHDVLSTDLIQRDYGKGNIDFLKFTKENLPEEYKPYLKCIFTNPPYAFSLPFIEKSLELLDNDGICIMFLKTTFLESQKRVSLFKKHKLKYVWQYVNRQGCGRNGGDENGNFENGGAAAYAMYIWDNSYNGLPEIDWIETPKKGKK